ncbi:MAG: hypothetical protein V3V05_00565 [Pontiella sp.]
MNDNLEYTFLGNFDLSDTKTICDLIEKQNINFELEIDDSPIRNMSPFQAAYGGTYGSGATANIYVQEDALEPCNLIVQDIRK